MKKVTHTLTAGDQTGKPIGKPAGLLAGIKSTILTTPEPEVETADEVSIPGMVPAPVTVSYVVTIPADLADVLSKPPTGKGGWQSLLADVKAHVYAYGDQEGHYLVVTPAMYARLVPYAVKFGGGGYQARIRHILCLLLAQHGPALLTGGDDAI